MKKWVKNLFFYLLNYNSEYVPTILMYHSINYNNTFFTVSPKDFDKQIYLLLEKGHNFITMDDVLNKKYNNKSIAITFDDGYKDNLTNALPVLEKYNVPAIIYVTKNLVNNKNKKYDLVGLNEKDIIFLSNHHLITIGNHTVSHLKLSKLNYEKIYTEINEAHIYLTNLINKNIIHFAYPKGYYNKDVIKILKKLNYKTAVTVKKGSIQSSVNNFELKRMSVDKGVMNFALNYMTKENSDKYYQKRYYK